ncbi:HD domain-containing protein [Candidatus Oleimmundimicrobium sp.]|uniref:HD domain-containing protein n=1 Tax=Candidatus Oleimmundimicrobium sp. TaxID=3060597 RepID=UPI00272839BB|nr:HD domain-containing protein [Candidatus Oleimmundimicrobium sp.]MDO8886716.1 HD domain-containing protein [Candidatus Oleimmundimicrobium sp.]
MENRITLDDLKKNESVAIYLEMADKFTGYMGYTEHGPRHANLVGHIVHNILKRLGYPERDAELGAMAGYLHDIGNAISRQNHGVSSAILAKDILEKMDMPKEEIGLIMNSVGNHEEEYGWATHPLAAALVIGDKADVHRSRVREKDKNKVDRIGDIHDRVNYAAEKSFLKVDSEKKTITLEIKIDTKISKVMEYFEIFLSRMIMCRKAAEILNCQFCLVINNVQLL